MTQNSICSPVLLTVEMRMPCSLIATNERCKFGLLLSCDNKYRNLNKICAHLLFFDARIDKQCRRSVEWKKWRLLGRQEAKRRAAQEIEKKRTREFGWRDSINMKKGWRHKGDIHAHVSVCRSCLCKKRISSYRMVFCKML